MHLIQNVQIRLQKLLFFLSGVFVNCEAFTGSRNGLLQLRWDIYHEMNSAGPQLPSTLQVKCGLSTRGPCIGLFVIGLQQDKQTLDQNVSQLYQ